MEVKGLYALGPTKFLSCCFYPFILKKVKSCRITVRER